MSFTVTATQSGSSSNQGMLLKCVALTSAAESGGASDGNTSTASVRAGGTLTPAFSGSLPVFSLSADGIGSGLNAAAASNTYDGTLNDTADFWSAAQGHYTGTVTSGTPLTYGESAYSGGDHLNWCAYEVPASGGTIAIDGSSPAAVSATSGTAVTTASFTPPGGAVLACLVVAGGTGSGTGITITMSDTSGLGLTWTRRAVSSATDGFQPAFIFTATIPGGAAVPGTAPVHLVVARRQAARGAWRGYVSATVNNPAYAPGPPVRVMAGGTARQIETYRMAAG